MVSAWTETIRSEYEIAEQKHHDVFDCFYVTLARQEHETKILTTDIDFRTLCREEEFDYLNPVSRNILSAFGRGSRSKKAGPKLR